MRRVAVIGGGIAGLAVAHALVRRGEAGLDVAVYERAPLAGGLVRTERGGGFVWECGPSGFLDSAPETMALVRALGLEGRLQPSRDEARRRFIVRAGRLRALPRSPLDLLTSGVLSPGGLARLALEPWTGRATDPDESIHAFAARHFGQQAADVLADAMASGIFGGDARALAMRACFPGVWQMDAEHGSLVRALLARRRQRPKAPRRGFGRLCSFSDGLQELPDALSRALGPRLQTSVAVESVDPLPDGAWRLSLGGGRTAIADAVVLTGGAAASARIVAAASPALAAELTAMPAAPIATVCLGYEAAALGRRLDGFGFLAPRNAGLRVLGVLWESSIFPGRAPDGHALLRVMIGGATDPGAVDLDDDALVAAVRADLASSLQIEGPPVLTRILRHRPGLPQYVAGHHDRMARIEAAAAGHRGLFIGGHAVAGVGVNACIAEAGPLADRVAGALGARAVA